MTDSDFKLSITVTVQQPTLHHQLDHDGRQQTITQPLADTGQGLCNEIPSTRESPANTTDHLKETIPGPAPEKQLPNLPRAFPNWTKTANPKGPTGITKSNPYPRPTRNTCLFPAVRRPTTKFPSGHPLLTDDVLSLPENQELKALLSGERDGSFSWRRILVSIPGSEAEARCMVAVGNAYLANMRKVGGMPSGFGQRAVENKDGETRRPFGSRAVENKDGETPRPFGYQALEDKDSETMRPFGYRVFENKDGNK
ncbi:hypothetical protein QBC39DRAFT_353406 [Podospora conica]|nr:hypothetical protein QBC39DRAFT_353406 [Schizothecium conicum]